MEEIEEETMRIGSEVQSVTTLEVAVAASQAVEASAEEFYVFLY